MILVCSWCLEADRPAFLREAPPYCDGRLSHGMCGPRQRMAEQPSRAGDYPIEGDDSAREGEMPAMKLRKNMACRGCGRTPAQRGDQVSDGAVEYVCCRCLIEGLAKKPSGATTRTRTQGTRGEIQAPRPAAGRAADLTGTSNTIFRDGRAGKAGRPQVPVAEQRWKARERARAYRRRRREVPGDGGRGIGGIA
jgi:hypothetical protein